MIVTVKGVVLPLITPDQTISLVLVEKYQKEGLESIGIEQMYQRDHHIREVKSHVTDTHKTDLAPKKEADTD